jgi:hypothetical protein
MQVNEMENEDDSLTLMFELSKEEEKALLQFALKKIIMEAVEDG